MRKKVIAGRFGILAALVVASPAQADVGAIRSPRLSPIPATEGRGPEVRPAPLPMVPGKVTAPLGAARAGDPFTIPPAYPRHRVRSASKARWARARVSDREITTTVAGAHGKLYAEWGGTAIGCSATVVRANNKMTIMTAAHCVYDRSLGGFATHVEFYPRHQRREFDNAENGTWFGKRIWIPARYAAREFFTYDVAAVVLGDPSPSDMGTIQDRVGGRGIRFNQSPDVIYSAYGYPDGGSPGFTGDSLFRCDSPFHGFDRASRKGPSALMIGCDMSYGASGGGWVAADRTGGGYLTSLTSYGFNDDPHTLGGPYFGTAALIVYLSAQNASSSVNSRTAVKSPPESDPAGNHAPTLERTPHRKVRVRGKHAFVRFRFRSTPGIETLCRLTGPLVNSRLRVFRPCESPAPYRLRSRSGPGVRYVFIVRTAGGQSADYEFTIKRSRRAR